jgi:uncharacterized membrane protein
MIRRRQVPVFHQYSRLLIGTIAILGTIDTAYLTWVKLSHNGICGMKDCEIVLASPFANIGDFPLTGLGLLSYIAVAMMAFAPTLINPKTDRHRYQQINDLTWLGLFVMGIGMAVFSGYLMYLLAFTIAAACPFCIASALFSLSIFASTLFGHKWEDLGGVIFMGIATALLSLLISLVLYHTSVPKLSISPSTPSQPGIGWPIKFTSDAAEIQLAEHLTKQGAKMYGSYWCPHCYEQKQLFGKQAWAKITYIECAEDAIENPQPKVCQQANIQRFPTWIIDGKAEPQVKKLAKLAEMTNYRGSTSFKYDRLLEKR